MLNVLLTIDTEVHPILGDWRSDRLNRDVLRDIYGQISDERLGLDYQIETFEKTGLKAVFMVEPLFSLAKDVDQDHLSLLLMKILSAGHEVQLHLHPEWTRFADVGVAFRGHELWRYSLDEQKRLIAVARNQLESLSVPRPIAFRAGGFCANLDTLKALGELGIALDSSYDVSYLGGNCRLPAPRPLGSPSIIEGVTEIPVGGFQDYPFHLRHAQVCACSEHELIRALENAERQGWSFFVIVMHTFEMIGRRWHPTKAPYIRGEVRNRFEKLCGFLQANSDRFRTIGFREVSTTHSRYQERSLPTIKGKMTETVTRLVSQARNQLQSKFSR